VENIIAVSCLLLSTTWIVPQDPERCREDQKALENQCSGAFFLSEDIPQNPDRSEITLQELVQELETCVPRRLEFLHGTSSHSLEPDDQGDQAQRP
jgi:hypothetical protein